MEITNGLYVGAFVAFFLLWTFYHVQTNKHEDRGQFITWLQFLCLLTAFSTFAVCMPMLIARGTNLEDVLTYWDGFSLAVILAIAVPGMNFISALIKSPPPDKNS